MNDDCDRNDEKGGFWKSLGTLLTTAAIVVLVFDRPDGRYAAFIVKAVAVLLIGLILYAYARAIIEGTL